MPRILTRVLALGLVVTFPGFDSVRAATPDTAARSPISGRAILEVESFGAKLDGSTDDSRALKKALAAAAGAGALVHVPASAHGMAIASSELPITVYSRTGLIGDGMDSSRIFVTGVGAGHLFKGANIRGFRVAGLSFTGNGQARAIDQGAAFDFQQDDSSAAVGGDIVIEKCRFTNFTSYYWLWFRNTGSSHAMSDIRVRGNVFESRPGNTIGRASLGPSSYMVSFEGQSDWRGSGPIGLIRDAWVEDNRADANFTKGFGAAWESTRNVHFARNTVLNAGQANEDEAANYAFLVYNNGGRTRSPNPDEIYIERNVIVAPRDAGVYSAMHAAPGGKLYVRNNTITGQNSRATDTLPKGAIAINGARLAIVEGNVVDSCYWGIAAIGQLVSQKTYIRGNRVTNAAASGQSIYIQPTLTGQSALFSVTDNDIRTDNANVRAILVRVSSTSGIAKLVIERNVAWSAYLPIEVASISGPALIGELSISSNECNGQGAAQAGIEALMSNAKTRSRISGNRFTGSWGTQARLLRVEH